MRWLFLLILLFAAALLAASAPVEARMHHPARGHRIIPQDLPGAGLIISPANPTGTVSAVGVMMGFGSQATITPQSTGKILITMSGAAGNALATATTTVYLMTGTGAPPANAAAITGTTRSSSLITRVVCNNCYVPYSTTFLITNAAIGTPIWIDAALRSDGINMANMVSAVISATEIVP